MPNLSTDVASLFCGLLVNSIPPTTNTNAEFDIQPTPTIPSPCDGTDDSGPLRALDAAAQLTSQVHYVQTQMHHVVGDCALGFTQGAEITKIWLVAGVVICMKAGHWRMCISGNACKWF